MKPETARKLNIAAAEYLGYERDPELTKYDSVYILVGDITKSFSPATDANDRKLVIEALKIDVNWVWEFDLHKWCAEPSRDIDLDCEEWPVMYDKSRDEAINKCMCKALGVDYE